MDRGIPLAKGFLTNPWPCVKYDLIEASFEVQVMCGVYVKGFTAVTLIGQENAT